MIGPYVTERLLGRGAMAAVYLCRDDHGEAVAVKWLDLCLPGAGPEDDALTPPLVRRYENELRSLMRLDHPGVVRYRDHGTWHGRPYLVMDHVEGGDLRVYTQKLAQRPASERYARCRTIGQALCEAVGAMHAVGLVHRDVKPSNVLVDPSGRVVLSDLGVVKDLGEVDGTQAGLVVGTIAYAAPEQLEGGEVDGRTDLFGVGATLYFLLTGERPFQHSRRRTQPELVPPSRHDPELPADLEAVILRLMAPHPEDRYADAAEAAQALAAPDQRAAPALAGRRKVVERVTRALDQVEEEGQSLVLEVRGTLGVGRSWLTQVVRSVAARRGLTLVEPAPGVAERVALQRAATEASVVILTGHALDAPPGVRSEVVELHPLGVADVRRTVVGTAPLTADASAVAERLHRWSGGLPALLLPLLEQFVDGARLQLPDTCPVLPAVDPFLDGLELDELELLGALAAIPGAVSLEDLERVALIPPEQPLATLRERGLVHELDGRWLVTAGMFREAAWARLPDPEGLHRRVAALEAANRPAAPSPDGPDPASLALDGRLGEALDRSRHRLATAQAEGDRVAECAALCTLGQVLLDVGLGSSAQRALANASALAKATGQDGLRRRSHVLRARQALDGLRNRRGTGRAVAASALDRLVPLSLQADERDDPWDALVLATWARASACLGDARSSASVADRCIERLDRVPPDLHSRCCLELARAAVRRRDSVGVERCLALLRPDQVDRGLVAWECALLRSSAHARPPPALPEALAEGLGEEERLALSTRFV